ncbi:DUF3800 domain-containing protein [Methylobacterium sp. J-067]|uniref:DUF3800 domain-containing protein n=1 Tax=Methylobacterium sp. J-067 TaxID=2836648 RepID=UPI001FBA1480|nr:DUF3800 domain-containing protein [Methylobacterium sp. J-067]MCJ2024397.1 DUF3800 domain-containing protein [Methylobacterium sp. J-067]
MAEWAPYLDETGSVDPHKVPVPTGETPLFTIGGVALPLDRWREYDRKYLYLKREFFSAEIDRSSKTDSAWEAKGSYLMGPHNASSKRNKVFCYKVLDLVKEFNGRVMGVSFVKSVRSPMNKTSIYTKGLQILAERFDVFLRENDSSGIFILDSRMAHSQKGKGLDRTVAISYLSFVFGNKDGQMLRRIIEAPMFADSALTAGLQIADTVAFMIYGLTYAEKLSPQGKVDDLGYLDYLHLKCYNRPLRDSVFKSLNTYAGGQQMYGLRTINHHDAPASDQSLQKLKQRFAKQEKQN